MNAVTGLAAVVSLLLALAAAGGQAEVSTAAAGGPASSQARVPGGGWCEDWGCGMNHNETLVSDATR